MQCSQKTRNKHNEVKPSNPEKTAVAILGYLLIDCALGIMLCLQRTAVHQVHDIIKFRGKTMYLNLNITV
jgi:hypothetical protein